MYSIDERACAAVLKDYRRAFGLNGFHSMRLHKGVTSSKIQFVIVDFEHCCIRIKKYMVKVLDALYH